MPDFLEFVIGMLCLMGLGLTAYLVDLGVRWCLDRLYYSKTND